METEPTGVIGAYDLNVSNTFTRVDSTGKHEDIVVQFDESERSKAARTANNKWLKKSEELYGKSGKRSSKRQLRVIEREANLLQNFLFTNHIKSVILIS